MRLGRVQHVHLVGIGGSGMSGIAEVLIREGFRVSGSDQKSTKTTLKLEYLGCKVYQGHEADNVTDADVLVYSSAVPASNPERVRADEIGIPSIKRGEMLAELMRLKVGVAVAGAHGKTTTTTLTGLVMDGGGLDPTVVVGGRILGVDGNTIPGRSEYMVAEADESDGSFLLLSHAFSIVTNMDREHLDHYGDYETLEDAFVTFMNEVPFWGANIVCADDPALMKLVPRVNRRVRTYGFQEGAEFRGEMLSQGMNGSEFRVSFPDRESHTFKLPVPGKHNVQNAIGAVALGVELGCDLASIEAGLARYQGIHRRLECRVQNVARSLYDDYAHHPTEIAATLSTLRAFTKDPVHAIFQPHRYSRTAELWDQFAGAFADADIVWVLPIYAAGEKPLAGIESDQLVAHMREQGVDNIHYLPEANSDEVLRHFAQGVMVTLGAGSITQFAEELARVLEETA